MKTWHVYRHIVRITSWTTSDSETVNFNYTKANYTVRELLGIISSLWFLRVLLPLVTLPHLRSQIGICRIQQEQESIKITLLIWEEKLPCYKNKNINIDLFTLFYFLPHFKSASLSKVTVKQCLRLDWKTLEFHFALYPLRMSGSCGNQMKHIRTVNWDLIFWLPETELLWMCSCRCLFHLDEVSRVELNNDRKYQPSFKWLQPGWN